MGHKIPYSKAWGKSERIEHIHQKNYGNPEIRISRRVLTLPRTCGQEDPTAHHVGGNLVLASRLGLGQKLSGCGLETSGCRESMYTCIVHIIYIL